MMAFERKLVSEVFIVDPNKIDIFTQNYFEQKRVILTHYQILRFWRKGALKFDGGNASIYLNNLTR